MGPSQAIWLPGPAGIQRGGGGGLERESGPQCKITKNRVISNTPVSKPISNHHRSDIVQISARYRKRHRTAYRFAHRLKVGPISWRLHIGPISGGYRFSHRTDILPSLDRYSVYRLDIFYDIGPISFCPLASSRTDIDLDVFHSLLLQDHLGGFHLNGFTHKHG